MRLQMVLENARLLCLAPRLVRTTLPEPSCISSRFHFPPVKLRDAQAAAVCEAAPVKCFRIISFNVRTQKCVARRQCREGGGPTGRQCNLGSPSPWAPLGREQVRLYRAARPSINDIRRAAVWALAWKFHGTSSALAWKFLENACCPVGPCCFLAGASIGCCYEVGCSK
jgi:hypothetical protein